MVSKCCVWFQVFSVLVSRLNLLCVVTLLFNPHWVGCPGYSQYRQIHRCFKCPNRILFKGSSISVRCWHSDRWFPLALRPTLPELSLIHARLETKAMRQVGRKIYVSPVLGGALPVLSAVLACRYDSSQMRARTWMEFIIIDPFSRLIWWPVRNIYTGVLISP